jgi:endoglycosylceramidase
VNENENLEEMKNMAASKGKTGGSGLKLRPDGFYDLHGRLAIFWGVNMAANAKFPPFIPFLESKWWDMLASWGFNVVRLTLFWEAIEPEPGVYDKSYLDKIERMVDQVSKRGIYALLNMHQDLYNRWLQGDVCGDGAPYWAFPPDVDPKNNAALAGYEAAMWSMAYSPSDEVKQCFTHFFES